jgi:hypothetical protein
LAFFAGLAVLAVAVMASFHYFVARPATRPMDRFVDALGALTQRSVEVDGITVALGDSEVSELVLVERHSRSLIKYETSWLGSDNVLIVRGDFRIKAGFDLDAVEPLEFRDGRVEGQWPPAEILSVELLDYEVFFSRNGAINKLKPEDQEKAVRRLLAQAREDAEAGDLREEAEGRLRERLQDLGRGEFELGEGFLP